jgi:diguanylate cyclase (GGDEF)-like protein/PAS domain S-box-containing protein
MKDSAKPPHFPEELEKKRVASLSQYEIFDNTDDELFHATVRLAAFICKTSMASISFIDGTRQWFKARVGLQVTEIPRDLAICSHTITKSSHQMVIEDIGNDERFAEHPFVTQAPHLRFYAGMSLISEEGLPLGTLCVMDQQARSLAPEQHEALTTLATQVMTQLALRRNNRKLRLLESAVRQSRDAFLVALPASSEHPGGRIEFVNDAFSSMTGHEPQSIVGEQIFSSQNLLSGTSEVTRYHNAVAKGEAGTFELRQQHLDGQEIDIELSLTPLHNESGQYQHFVTIMRDITDRKTAEKLQMRAEVLEAGTAQLEKEISERIRAEQRLLHDASHDSLTQLWNRTYFMEAIGNTVEHFKHSARTNAAVLFIDLDRFKVVNDSLGHTVGDEMLVMITKRIQACLDEHMLIARLGGDEFTVLIEGYTDHIAPQTLATDILTELEYPFHAAGREIYLSASIGIAYIHSRYDTPEEILRDADTAMYSAKNKGRSCFEVFTPQLHSEALAVLQLENDLRQAIDRREFLVYYQPIISLTNGHVADFEALVRWRHPRLGIMAPDKFIALAEETGAIIAIGTFVLDEATRQCRLWNKENTTNTQIGISVNVSAKQLAREDFSDIVIQTLRRNQLPPNYLHIEITESLIATDSEDAIRALTDLRTLGISVHMDDFGTGYSSLSYLDKLPIDLIKIDQSFVSDKIHSSLCKPDIVRAIVSMAQSLGLEVTAEGVETPEQAQALHEIGCDRLQGYFFSKPMETRSVIPFIQTFMHASLDSNDRNPF